MGKKTDAAERQRTKTSGNAGEQTDKTNKPSIKVYIAVYDSLPPEDEAEDEPQSVMSCPCGWHSCSAGPFKNFDILRWMRLGLAPVYTSASLGPWSLPAGCAGQMSHRGWHLGASSPAAATATAADSPGRLFETHLLNGYNKFFYKLKLVISIVLAQLSQPPPPSPPSSLAALGGPCGSVPCGLPNFRAERSGASSQLNRKTTCNYVKHCGFSGHALCPAFPGELPCRICELSNPLTPTPKSKARPGQAGRREYPSGRDTADTALEDPKERISHAQRPTRCPALICSRDKHQLCRN